MTMRTCSTSRLVDFDPIELYTTGSPRDQRDGGAPRFPELPITCRIDLRHRPHLQVRPQAAPPVAPPMAVKEVTTMALSPAQARVALVALRSAVGAAAWMAPEKTGRLFGIDLEDNVAGPYLGRLFGARDIAMAAMVMAAESKDRRRQLRVGILVDSLDATAAIIAGTKGRLTKRSAAMAAAVALAAAGLGVVAQMERESSEDKLPR